MKLLWLLLCVAPWGSAEPHLPHLPRLPRLPALPMEGGCLVVSPEVELFRVEGEPVILSFPFLHSVLKARGLSVSGASVLVAKADDVTGSAPSNSALSNPAPSKTAPNVTFSPAPNAASSPAPNVTSSPTPNTTSSPAPNVTSSPASNATSSRGRVLQQGAQLWLLPAQESDSGTYTCTYRTEGVCVRGRVSLQVFSSPLVHMDKLQYRIKVSEGEHVSFRCPGLNHFNSSDTHVLWDKVSGARGPFASSRGRLQISSVRRAHGGLYRCHTTVSLRAREFGVSAAVLITVREKPDALPSDPPVTPDPETTTAQIPPDSAPPVILSPVNGSVFETSHGSAVELFCVVLTDCAGAESTEVTWSVNGHSVESSYLGGRALQGGRRVGGASGRCLVELPLIVMEMRERDAEAELKCIAQNQHGRQEVGVRLQAEDVTRTWLLVAGASLLCLLSVVSGFLCVLFRPARSRSKHDYALASRQESCCSDL